MAKEKKNRLTVKTVIRSILSGNILILLGVDRLLPYILFLFILGWANIFFNYRIEKTLTKVEKCNKVLEQRKNDFAIKTYEFVSAGKKSTVKKMLEDNNSEGTTPQKPATIIKID